MGKSKYRTLPDLFVTGQELVWPNGVVMWLNVMNPFEIEEARRDAAVARTRFVLACQEVGNPEYDQLVGAFRTAGREKAIREIVDARRSDVFAKTVDQIRVDPDWKERYEIIDRGDQILGRPDYDPEVQLLTQINREWLAEVDQRVQEDLEYERVSLDQLTDEDLLAAYQEEWATRRGMAFGMAEYSNTEIFYSCRVCDAEPPEEGESWNHDACGMHVVKVYDDRDEVRRLPEDLKEFIREGLSALAMSVRDAKNSHRPGSSFDSSPRLEQVEESTVSTPEGT